MIKSISMLVRASKRPGRLVLVVIVACLVLVGSSSAVAAPPAPVFKITQAAAPTNLVPGSDATSGAVVPAHEALPQYSVTVTNLGGAATSGEVTVVDTLPVGVAPAPPPAAAPTFRVAGEEHYDPCAVAGQTVTCVVPETVQPTNYIEVGIPVDVAADAPASVTNEVHVSGGGAVEASGSISTTVSASPAVFGFLPGEQGFSVNAVNADGTTTTQAGAHPFTLTFDTAFPSQQLISNQEEGGYPMWGAGTLRDLEFSLPKGMVVNPNATPVRCTAAQLASSENPKGGGCPPASEIGEIRLLTNLFTVNTTGIELYNMVPVPGVPAEFAFDLVGTFVHVRGGLNGDFTLSAATTEILAKIAAFGVQVVLWGDPSSSAFEYARLGAGCQVRPCPVISSPTPLLTMPSACSGPLSMSASADSWEDPGSFLDRTAVTTDLNGNPVGVSGCDNLAFDPTISVQPESHAADSPSGLSVDLKLPQSEGVDSLATANLKRAVVQLPAGMVVNPSAADGLAGCSPAEIGIGSNASQSCPDGSKIGEVQLTTPLLATPLQGSVYLAEQDHNPFGSLLAVYLVAEGQGVVVKLPGKVEPDPVTGQLTATFSENPDLPFSDLKVHFDGGPRATLSTPPACGSYQSTSALSPWSAADPEHPTAAETRTSYDPFQVSTGPGGTTCATDLAFAPGFQAGVTNPVAGASSSFVLQLTRQDGEQNISAITTALPQGLLAKVAGVPLCPETQAASGECPAASQVGETTIGVGSGPTPLYVPQPGKSPTAVYLAGPYKGAPYSLVIKVPAQAGPFDLGTVTVRAAVHIDPNDAHVTVTSDPLPQVLQGIPLRYRDIRVSIDRPGFMLNPTSCQPVSIAASIASTNGATVNPSTRFQTGDCQNLPFKPLMSISTQGKTSKANGASLTVKLSQKPGEADIHKVDVTLPAILPARLTTLQQACTEAQFNTNPAGCPPGSFIGTAKAITPILNTPLIGPAILVSHGGAAFPDVVFLLQANEGGSSIRIDLDGRTDIKKGITYSRFETVPDAPISSFETNLPQGPHSVLSANGNLCASKLAIPTEMTGQNGALVSQGTKLTVTGCPKTKTLTRAQKLALALKACHKKPKGAKRTNCEHAAHKKYGSLKKKTKKK